MDVFVGQVVRRRLLPWAGVAVCSREEIAVKMAMPQMWGPSTDIQDPALGVSAPHGLLFSCKSCFEDRMLGGWCAASDACVLAADNNYGG